MPLKINGVLKICIIKIGEMNHIRYIFLIVKLLFININIFLKL